MHEPLGRWPISVTIQVAWGEMDAFQHVNNVVYAGWVQAARIEYLRRLGMFGADARIGPVLGRLAIDYRRPVTFPDAVRVDVTVAKIGRTSLTMRYRIVSEAQGAEVASAEDVTVVYDFQTGEKAPVGEALRAAIVALEGTAPPAAPSAGVRPS